MKIKFIYPDRYASSKKPQFSFFRTPPLNLLTLAGLTPGDVEIKIVDERYRKIDFDDPVDLVAITSLTCNASHAYEIADEYRKRGVWVVLGGIHPTFMRDEAKLHTDTIVAGEAEDVWGKLVNDFKNGCIKDFYSSPPPGLSRVPIPRWDLLPDRKRYFTFVQTSRGCPNDCAFCSVTRFSGRRMRVRPVESVIKEIKSAGISALQRFIVFVDDNIIGNIRHAKELFNRLIPLKIKWGSEASINFLKYPGIMKLAAKSGCKALFIGFESISQNALKEVNKGFNKVIEYKKLIRLLHHYGIAVVASLMVGFDDDSPDIFRRTINFLDEAEVDALSLSILTPLPGTRLYDKLKKENRIFEKDWSKFDCLHSTFFPKKMSPRRLELGLDTIYREFYGPMRVLRRLIRIARACPFMIPVNIGFMFGVRKGLVPDRNRKIPR
jgi:radical SAM superfamily enzyme YgiQ (UPF0313 family)